ncbi:SRPBCC domain-containing protein [Hymenobacter monticola]|uniref:SRPBCC domain-containing protein n=1 Tax=Hymenobacter monticola TaxID=1705399 RepID=A0ABY4B932_9BACT|nr:SRPBCC domain-containing protein [Hymenobacter monticola]UOE35652.1 SRPBCC domain-containing protein [Hymenobacter monticola]
MSIPLVTEHVYEAPIEKVWQALTDTKQLQQWYFPQVQRFEPVVGFRFEFADDGSPYGKAWVVTDAVAGRKLAHTWAYKNYPGSSEVTFALAEQGDKTTLTLTHTGLESFPQDPHFARRRFEDGWAQILGSNLKDYLERNG